MSAGSRSSSRREMGCSFSFMAGQDWARRTLQVRPHTNPYPNPTEAYLSFIPLEALSEESQRPLYRITTGELGTQVDQFERRLASVFRLGHRWGAIVLLDEADIVMAKRDKNNLDRNALVGGQSTQSGKGRTALWSNAFDISQGAIGSLTLPNKKYFFV